MLAPLDFQGGITQTKTAEISVVFAFIAKEFDFLRALFYYLIDNICRLIIPDECERSFYYGRRYNGQDRCPCKKSRLRLPGQRNLRRSLELVGLRPARRADEKQHQAGLVEEICGGKPLQRWA